MAAFCISLVACSAAAEDEVGLGQKVYEVRCMHCHGIEGKGDGAAAPFLDPKPRDFTRGQFKIRSTMSGFLPTDDDLFKTVSEGMPGTSMPAWKELLSEEERREVVDYIKTLGPADRVQLREILDYTLTSKS